MDPLAPEHPIVTTAWERLAALGKISDQPHGLTRSFLSPASRRAAERIAGWMTDSGLTVEHDALGNLRGRHPGTLAKPPLLLGSHYDTVVDAGKFDGPLGIIAALAALDALQATGSPPTKPVDILAFADEEGVRFHATYLGSRACIGTLDPGLLSTRDAAGSSIEEVIAAEGWHEGATEIRYRRGGAGGYVELHIEQGRVLEDAGLALGVVPSICAQTRGRIRLLGRAEHAGTTPMAMRHDALAGAAECVLVIEKQARLHPPLVATVGVLETLPGAGNSVPGECRFTLDVRHPGDAELADAVAAIRKSCHEIASARGLGIDFEIVQQSASVQADPHLIGLVEKAVSNATGSTPPHIPSGAGHDAVVMSGIAPMAMIFLRCEGGLSHHPGENITRADLAAGISALASLIDLWCQTPDPP